MRSREILSNQIPQNSELIDKATKSAEKGAAAMAAGSVITLYIKPEFGLPLIVGGGVIAKRAYKKLGRLESGNISPSIA